LKKLYHVLSYFSKQQKKDALGYGIWLGFNNQKEGFQIPVNPPRIEVNSGNENKTYEIAKFGEIAVIKSPRLRKYSFESEFPTSLSNPNHWVSNLMLEPEYYIDTITKWMKTQHPIRFVYTGEFDINVAATVESFDYWEEVTGCVQYKLSLKEYRFYSAKKATIVKDPKKPETNKIVKKEKQRPDQKKAPKTYKLKKGDTLSSVAKSQLGNANRWREIKELNHISDAQVKKLQIGQVLKLPAK
jgi:LysM domain